VTSWPILTEGGVSTIAETPAIHLVGHHQSEQHHSYAQYLRYELSLHLSHRRISNHPNLKNKEMTKYPKLVKLSAAVSPDEIRRPVKSLVILIPRPIKQNLYRAKVLGKTTTDGIRESSLKASVCCARSQQRTSRSNEEITVDQIGRKRLIRSENKAEWWVEAPEVYRDHQQPERLFGRPVFIINYSVFSHSSLASLLSLVSSTKTWQL